MVSLKEVEVAAALVDFRVGEEAGQERDDGEAASEASSQRAGRVGAGLGVGAVVISMPEVPARGEDHDRSGSGRRGDLGVPLRAAGWTIIETPTSSANCGPSGKGKNASEGGPRRRSCPVLPPLRGEERTASTRLIWPAPIPIVCLCDHDRVQACLATARESPQPSSSGCDSVTTVMPSRSSTSASVSWTRKPPSTRRKSRSPGHRAARGRAGCAAPP